MLRLCFGFGLVLFSNFCNPHLIALSIGFLILLIVFDLQCVICVKTQQERQSIDKPFLGHNQVASLPDIGAIPSPGQTGVSRHSHLVPMTWLHSPMVSQQWSKGAPGNPCVSSPASSCPTTSGCLDTLGTCLTQ